jgi:hypothetical protein
MILISIWIKESVFDPKASREKQTAPIFRGCSLLSSKIDLYFIPANEKGEGMIS